MAEPHGSALAPYRAVLGSRIRSQASYRTSFGLDLGSSLLVGLTELAEVAVLFTSVSAIGGFDLAAMLLVFGLADLCFSLADMVVGHCDNLPEYVRTGRLDVFYLRPQPLLLQLVTSDISLRRLARAAVGLVALVVGLVVNDLAWGPGTVGLLAVALVSGTVTFAALFVWAGGLQFFLVNGSPRSPAPSGAGRWSWSSASSSRWPSRPTCRPPRCWGSTPSPGCRTGLVGWRRSPRCGPGSPRG